MNSQPPWGMPTDPQHMQEKRQLLLLRLQLAGLLVFAGGAILVFSVMLVGDVWNCFTLGCSARLPMRIRSFWSPVEMPVHVHIAFDGAMLLFLLFILRMGYGEMTERIRELQARIDFDGVMQRIRAGEDVDNILSDLKKRHR